MYLLLIYLYNSGKLIIKNTINYEYVIKSGRKIKKVLKRMTKFKLKKNALFMI